MVKRAAKAKVAVYTCGLDIAQTETKGTVLLKNANEMLNFTRGEELHIEKVLPHVLPPSGLCTTRDTRRSSRKSQTPE